MAVTAALARTTTYSKSFLLVQDGQVGTTVTITHANLIAGLPGGAFLELLTSIIAANTQSQMRERLLGNAFGEASQNLVEVPHCECWITGIDAALGWAVDADVDGVTAGAGELNVTGPAGAAEALLTLHFRHTYER